MPKKTRLQKLRNSTRNTDQLSATQVLQKDESFFSIDPQFRHDLLKSIFFAVGITVFEIAIYIIYYLRVFERR